ncbi:sensor histidine kinase, partial [Micromonospora sp. DH15]|nr:sensor histidine kinase [Micromonospora sp. DH15]
PGAGAGLVGMRERAVLLGGGFTAGPADGRWRVRARLPTGEPA